MLKKISLSEARSRLPTLVREAEHGQAIQITRHGRGVAVIISALEYQQLKQQRPSVWQAISAFRKELDIEKLDLDVDALFGNVRDRTPGREVPL